MERKKVLAYVALAAIVVILLLLLGKKSTAVITAAQPDDSSVGPYYLSYNYPQTNLPTVDASQGYIPSQSNSDSSLPTCGCMGISQSFFASSNELTDYFNNQLKDLATTYYENVVENLPDWFGQYINNTSGANLSNIATQGLTSI